MELYCFDALISELVLDISLASRVGNFATVPTFSRIEFLRSFLAELLKAWPFLEP